MADLHITEALPEAEHAVWVTLSDGLTRLLDLRPLWARSTHRALRLRRLVRRPRVSPDGEFVLWPGGATLDVASVQLAPGGPLPVDLQGLGPQALRYRPLAALLRYAEPPVPDYLDVRPEHVVRLQLGLTPNDLAQVTQHHAPAPPEQLLARLSDLVLALRLVLPGDALLSLLRRPWPYAQRHAPQSALLHTAHDCLRHGRIDLVEAPLVALLLPSGRTSAPC